MKKLIQIGVLAIIVTFLFTSILLLPFSDGCTTELIEASMPTGGFGYNSTPLGEWTTTFPIGRYYVAERFNRNTFVVDLVYPVGGKVVENNSEHITGTNTICTTYLAAGRRTLRKVLHVDTTLLYHPNQYGFINEFFGYSQNSK